jgi:hypothetical protein
MSPALFAGDSTSLSIPQLQNARIPDQKIIDDYLNNKDYQYGGDYQPPESNKFLNRVWRAFLKLITLGFKALSVLPWIFKIVIGIAAVVLIYFILARTTLHKLVYSDRNVPMPEAIEIDPMDENYDFNKAILNELKLHNFRNAIRLLHLKTLKDLEAKGILRLSKDKTNRDYTIEIADATLRAEFVALTSVYNQVWYGKFALSNNEFDKMHSGFRDFSNKLQNGKE